MFIAHGINKYPKAPEGRHVYPKGGTQEEWLNQPTNESMNSPIISLPRFIGGI